jgi:hypothetical protein
MGSSILPSPSVTPLFLGVPIKLELVMLSDAHFGAE